MISQNEKESLTLEDAQDLQVCRAIKNVYTGAICTIVDRKIPTNGLDSVVGDTLYEVRKTGGCDCPSFILSASALFSLYHYALSEDGNRYCIAVFNYEREDDEKLNKNEEEDNMKNTMIKIEELTAGDVLKAKKSGIIKEVEVTEGEVFTVRKIYTDRRCSLNLPVVKEGKRALSSLTEKLLNEYFEIVVEEAVQTEIDLEEVIEKDVEENPCGNGCGCCGCCASHDVGFDREELKGIAVPRGKSGNRPVTPALYVGNPKYKFIEQAIINDITTIVILDDGSKGIAKCDLEMDEFNEQFGLDLAHYRALQKRENKNYKEFVLETTYMKAELEKAIERAASVHNKTIKSCDRIISKMVGR